MDTIDKGLTIRRLAAQDFDAVVGMDATAVGHARASYFERRLKKAQSRPSLYVQCGAELNGKLVGFMMARKMQGQFGRKEPALRLDAFAVAEEMRGQQVGSALLAKLQDEAGKLKIDEIRTTASWRDHSIVRFLDHAGFELGNELVVDCQVKDQKLEVHKGNNFEALARDKVDFSTLKPDDLYDIVGIDKEITGQRREAFFYELVDEATRDSAVRVSLVARIDGKAAGFVMARTSFGDYGRTEPVAVLDTIGVDPSFSHRGLGHALLSQLFSNLDELGVERVETVVANNDFQLLRFFYNVGLVPSQRLAFVKRLG